MDIQNFTAEFKKTFIYDMLCETLEDEQLFEHTIVGNQVIWMKEQTRQMWSMWQAAEASAVPEGFVIVPRVPTEEMIMNGLLVISTEVGKYDIQKEVQMIWGKMIEAQEPSHDS